MKLVLVLALSFVSIHAWAQEDYPVPAVHNRVSDDELKKDKDIWHNIAERMPMWDEDKPAKFERHEIQLVKDDLSMCSQAYDVDEFVEDFDLLLRDFEALVALDEVLHRENVI